VNYEGQDRSCDVSQIINFAKNTPNSLVLNTEHSDKWGAELEIIQKAKVIICHDGSSGAVI